MNEHKHRVRSEIRGARIGLPVEYRKKCAAEVAERLLAMPETADVRAVLGYAATSEELDPAPALEALRGRGVRVAYPRVCGPGVLAAHWAEADELTAGYCGLLEPPVSAAEAEPSEIDLVLVPGVAFDEECHRLGMGGGFYDRFLGRLHPGALVIGLAFDEQIIDRVPREEHDVQLDAVVTPTRVRRRAR